MTQSEILHLRARKLIAFANGLLAIARDLERLAATPSSPAPDEGEALLSQDQPHLLEMARDAYLDRRRREKVFDPSLFGEPTWDILLDLFIAAKEGKRVSVTSACIASSVPPTTALRWIAVLENMGLIRRENDPKDARRAFLYLTADAYSKMIEYFSYKVSALVDDSTSVFG